MTNDLITRRDALRFGALGVGALGLAACGSSSSSSSTGTAAANTTSPVTLNMLTWNDHYNPATQLPAIKKETGISVNVTLGSDDASMFIKAQQSGQFDIVSADALWVPYYYQQGLTYPFDIDSFAVSKQLYSVAREFQIWNNSAGYLAYPRAWSALRIYYNPKFVSPAPTSWEVLLDPKYHGKFVRENQPTDIVAEAGLATGSKDPYNMNSAELSRAVDFLKQAKPAFLTLVSQNTGVVQALTNESAWFTSENLGTDFRVKEAGGPTILAATPKEGVIGWLDAEQKMKTKNADRFEPVHQRVGSSRMDSAAVQGVQGGVVQREGVQDAGESGSRGARRRTPLQPARAGAQGAPEGPVEEPQRVHPAFNSVFGA